MAEMGLNIEVEAKLTVSKDTAEACLGLLELYLKNNPNMEIRCNATNGFGSYLAEKDCCAKKKEEE